jgi:hypothetical protein
LETAIKSIIYVALLTACSVEEEAGAEVQLDLDSAPAVAEGAWVVLSEFELLQCTDESLASALARFFIAPAHAHTTGSPVLLGTPHVVPLHGAPVKATLGVLKPPPGDYCGLAVRIAPADEDAVRLGGAPELTGTSVRVEPLGVASQARREVKVGFGLLKVEAERVTITLTVDGAATFETVGQPPPSALPALLLDALVLRVDE